MKLQDCFIGQNVGVSSKSKGSLGLKVFLQEQFYHCLKLKMLIQVKVFGMLL